MPRTKLAAHVEELKRPAGELVTDMFGYYMRKRSINSTMLGKRLGKSPSGIRQKKARGGDAYTLADFKDWCRELQIPPQEAAETIAAYLQK